MGNSKPLIMKILLLILLSAFTFQGLAQDPDPELFQTWYLFKIEIKWSNGVLISEIEPSISPWLTINESLGFNGFGACNEFSGNFEYIPASNEFDPINYTESLFDCETEFHDALEDEYFGYFKWPGELLSYFFYTDSDGIEHLVLSKGSPGFELNFVNTQLSVNEFFKNEIKIHPNPATKILTVSTENNPIEKLAVYSVSGRKVLEQNTAENSIDVSGLQNGIYFLEITSSEGKSVRKFIKQ